jgi:hypothetical protein
LMRLITPLPGRETIQMPSGISGGYCNDHHPPSNSAAGDVR